MDLLGLFTPFNDNRLYYLTRLMPPPPDPADVNKTVIFTLHEIDTDSGKIMTEFKNVVDVLFPTNGRKIYFATGGTNVTSGFAEYDIFTKGNMNILLTQEQFQQQFYSENERKHWLSLVGFGRNEDELIFAERGEGYTKRFYSYDVGTKELKKLFSTDPVEVPERG